MVMKTKKTTRRLQVKNALANAIREAKTPTYSQIVEAKALARKLMGIPDLYSEKYLNKERKHLMKLSRIVSECAQFITFYSEDRGALVSVHKNWLVKINSSIEAANDYRKTNNFFFLGIPQLKTLELDTITKSIKNLVVVLQCKTCNSYLSNRVERKHERCEECFEIRIESEAKNLMRKSKGLTMPRALIKARKIEDSLSSSLSFTNQLNPYSSTNTRGRMDMKHKNSYANVMPMRQEVSHK
tara:strand:- start:1053 stop:1778 length:726 start_codon:yes stop_codon:yes gene_type:complete